jgi:hypothetical protein
MQEIQTLMKNTGHEKYKLPGYPGSKYVYLILRGRRQA